MKKLYLICMIFGLLHAGNNYSTRSDWLLDINTTNGKFMAIQKQFRGFDLAMVEVGYRFNTFYYSIKDKNYDLALYNWDKIKKAMENGIIRRPKRALDAKSMFLNSQYNVMRKALQKHDAKAVAEAYEETKILCNACHISQKVPFIEVIDPEYRWQPIR